MNKKLNGALTLVGFLTVTSYAIDVTTKTTKKLIKKYNEKKNNKSKSEVIDVKEFEEVAE